jgi:hypothetical protein
MKIQKSFAAVLGAGLLAAASAASAQQGYDFLKRDNPLGMGEQAQTILPRLSGSVNVEHLGVTVFQSKAADGQPLLMIDEIDPSGPLRNVRNQILSASVAINAVDSYHPATVAQLTQIMSVHRSGDIVKLELLQLLPHVGFGSLPVRLD